MVDDRIVIPKSLRYAALNVLHFGHPGINKMCNDAAIFLWPNMREDIEKKSKTFSGCLNAGKNLKVQIPTTKKTKIEPQKTPVEEIQIDFTGNLHSKKLPSHPFILVGVNKNSRWQVAKICKNTNHETVMSFSRHFYLQRIQRILQIAKNRPCIRYVNLHTGTRLVERTIQPLENLVIGNLEDD